MRKALLAVMTVAIATACEAKLDKTTAEALIARQYLKLDGARCTWTAPSQITDDIWGFAPFQSAIKTCAEQFAEQGPVGLDFRCGKIELGDVTSIVTAGNKATVKFRRAFKPEPILEKLTACRLDRPAAGTVELTREFVRGDDGTWRAP